MQWHKIINQNSTHFYNDSRWGNDAFAREENKKMIVEGNKYCQKEKGLIVNAFVISFGSKEINQ